MNDRAKELWSDFLRYLKEAALEWWDNVEDSPPSHAYTLLLGALIAKILGWIV